jgi:hypothetical protein
MGKGTFLPGVSISAKLFSAARKISFCCNGLFGAPALAPIGTIGDTPRGAPHLIEISGSAEIIIVGMPDPSTAL